MAQQDSRRKVSLTFGGDAFAGGDVPLTLLAKKLEALQNILFHAAATVKHDTAARRGQWANRYRSAVELRFAAARPGSLVIEADLAAPATPLLGNEYDLGLEALDLSFRLLRSVSENREQVTQIVPDRQERALLLRSIENLAPYPDEQYYLEVANGAVQHPAVRLFGTSRLTARILVLQEALLAAGTERETTIVGTLTKIHYDIAPQKISVRVAAGSEIDCYYDESLRDQVANLCAGSVVEVVGIGSSDAEGRIKQIDSVTGVETVSMEPVRLTQLEHHGARYRLVEPLPVSIEYAEGAWVYSNPALGLWGFADKRDEAVRDFAAAFDFAYREIAEEADEALDAKAVELKRQLLALVASNQAGGG